MASCRLVIHNVSDRRMHWATCSTFRTSHTVKLMGSIAVALAPKVARDDNDICNIFLHLITDCRGKQLGRPNFSAL